MTTHDAGQAQRDGQADDLLCRCSGTTVGHVRRCIERGEADLESISRATGASSGCGACDTDILALLAEHAAKSNGEEQP